MNEILVVYWSGSGNTQEMAKAISQGVKDAGVDVVLKDVSEVKVQDIHTYDHIIFGCPSMGDEVLEESEFEPLFLEVEGLLKGKKVALFGSYGWGDGQWMRDWQERVIKSGAQLFLEEGLIINESPDADGLQKCVTFGSEFTTFS